MNCHFLLLFFGLYQAVHKSESGEFGKLSEIQNQHVLQNVHQVLDECHITSFNNQCLVSMDEDSREIGLTEQQEEEKKKENQKDSNIAHMEQSDGGDPVKKQVISHIPEDLIEGIVSRVSYPYLYKARLLCKSWYRKFLIPSHENVNTPTPSPFQNEVTAAAVEWPKYGPVSVFGKEIVGYDRSSNCWSKQAMHERVPVDVYGETFISYRLRFAGSLLCAVGRSQDRSLQLLVANILTGDWNALPSPPENRGHPILDFRFVPVDSHTYKILVHNLPCPQFQAHLYESSQSCGTWKSFTNSSDTVAGIPGLSPFSAYTDAYINETLYCMSQDSTAGSAMAIWKFSTDKGIWEQLLRAEEFENEEYPGGMFQCGEQFIVVTLLPVNSPSPAAEKQSCLAAKVYELNLQSLTLIKMSRSTPELVLDMQTATLLADTECIYFCDIPGQGASSFTSFNVNELSWSCLPSPFPQYKWNWGRLSTFEPGLNPFACP